jgi:adenine-specific DNA-methyltransferase
MAEEVVDRQRVTVTSTDPGERRLSALRELVPEAAGERGIDWERLRTAFGEAIDERPDRYRFEWAGKRDAITNLQRPSTATLVPVPKESINLDATRHVFIEGENLEVLKLLYKPYAGRVKMIYIDPPYNTGNDFIYRDDYSRPLEAYLEQTGQKEARPADARDEAERAARTGRLHSDWLSMMYPRLFLARQLLRDDGVIFVSIDDNEVHHLRMLMNELFGEENFIATIIWQKVYAPKNTAKHFSEDHDYIVAYARNAERWRPVLLPRSDEALARYANSDNDSRGPWKPSDLLARNFYSKGTYSVQSPAGKGFKNPTGTYWRVSKERFQELDRDGRIYWGPSGSNMPALKRFLSEVREGIVPQTLWPYKSVGHTQDAKRELLDFVRFKHTENVLNTVKPTRLVQRMLKIATIPTAGDIVLDFFAGSGSTMHAVLNQNAADRGNRRCISVQLPEPLEKPEPELRSIADIAKVRAREAIRRMNKVADGQLGEVVADRPEDLGLAVYRLAQGCFRGWPNEEVATAERYIERLQLFADPLRDGWQPLDVITEVAIKEAGFGLNPHMEKLVGVATNTVYRVTDRDRGQHFHICLDDRLHPETPKVLGLHGDTDLFVCRDVAVDDTLAANLALQCRLRTI